MLKKLIICAITLLSTFTFAGEKAKVILIAGQDSHGPGDHEFLAGCTLLKTKLDASMGDKIETKKADWIFQFVGKSLQNPTLKLWKVKKDGGMFDQFTGATITPRAVVNALRETLKLDAQGPASNE